MKDFVSRLRCPACRSQERLALTVSARDRVEVRSGTLSCPDCGAVRPITDGIVDMLVDPPDFVVREAAGLGRYAEEMREVGWTREMLLKLPYVEYGYWFAQATLMNQVLDTVPMRVGDTILDLGSNTCWASSTFAERGMDVCALDIATHEMQGLSTAEWWFEAKQVHFERVLGLMFDLPFADASFDFVWACEVLHHNHRANLAATLAECFRVLRPGGQLIVCNEPLRSLRTPKLRPGHEVAEFEGHEHAYMRFSYVREARRAGFAVDVRGPRYHGIFQTGEIEISDRMSALQTLRARTAMRARRSDRVKRAVLASRAYVRGGTALHMLCTKPAA